MLLPQALFDQIVAYCEKENLGACVLGKDNIFDAIVIGRKEITEEGPVKGTPIPLEETLVFLAHIILAGVVEGRFREDYVEEPQLPILAEMPIDGKTKKH